MKKSIKTRLFRSILSASVGAMLSFTIIHAITSSLGVGDFVLLQFILALPMAFIISLKFKVIFEDMFGWKK